MSYIISILALVLLIALATLLPGHNYTRVVDYWILRKTGLRDAWRVSGMHDVSDRLVGVVMTTIAIALVGYMISDKANAMSIEADQRVSAATGEQSQYVQGLEKIVAACVTDSGGQLVKIGNEYFLCGISPLGSFR